MAHEEVYRTLLVHHDAMHVGPWGEHSHSGYLELLSKNYYKVQLLI